MVYEITQTDHNVEMLFDYETQINQKIIDKNDKLGTQLLF